VGVVLGEQEVDVSRVQGGGGGLLVELDNSWSYSVMGGGEHGERGHDQRADGGGERGQGDRPLHVAEGQTGFAFQRRDVL
jgi:hypothetical protein